MKFNPISALILSGLTTLSAAGVPKTEDFCLVPNDFSLPHYIKPVDRIYDKINQFCSKYIYTDKSEKTVNLPNGATVIGNYWKETREFLGIPYAIPPVDERRWKAPEPLPAYDKPYVIDGRQYGHHCTQMSHHPDGPNFLVGFKSEPSEDCLNLNVYTPRRSHIPKEGLPVIIFIHGGSFTSGGSSMVLYNPQEMISKHKNVIVVTINYRLGVMGFMASKDLKAESNGEGFGNYGLLDQLAALEWVSNNISAFGGDPSRVTLMGHSAGSISVHHILHITQLEKYSRYRSMFKRVVMLSGTINAWPLRALNDGITQETFNIIKKNFDCDVYDAMSCLRKVPAEDLSKFALDNNWTAIWGPTMDGVLIKERAAALAQASVGSDIAVFASSTIDDGTMFVKPVPKTHADTKEQLRNSFEDEAQLSKVCAHYPINKFDSEFYRLATVVRDAFFRCPAVSLTSSLTKNGVQAYYFQYNTPIKFANIATRIMKGHSYGAFHGVEVIYLFEFNKAILLPRERRKAHKYQKQLIAFATSGNPNVAGSNKKILTDPKTKSPYSDCQFWDTVGAFHIPLPKNLRQKN